jgi:TetR/AcrR family transcriptional regulator, mexJK operon transcriptional repressor
MPAPPPVLDDESRSARKHQAILDAATAIFLRSGYLGTSMDEIAAAARVSKQTVYKHFADKESLFVEIVIAMVDEISDPVHDEVLQLAESGNVEEDLTDLARRLLRRVMQPRLLELRRLVIAEAARFPDLGRTFYERGPGRTIQALTAVFKQLSSRGELHIADASLAASQFNWLVMAAPINQAMLLGDGAVPKRAALNRHAANAVRTFLAAYLG